MNHEAFDDWFQKLQICIYLFGKHDHVVKFYANVCERRQNLSIICWNVVLGPRDHYRKLISPKPMQDLRPLLETPGEINMLVSLETVQRREDPWTEQVIDYLRLLLNWLTVRHNSFIQSSVIKNNRGFSSFFEAILPNFTGKYHMDDTGVKMQAFNIMSNSWCNSWLCLGGIIQPRE